MSRGGISRVEMSICPFGFQYLELGTCKYRFCVLTFKPKFQPLAVVILMVLLKY